MLKKYSILFLVFFLIIQVIRPAKNNTTQPQNKSITTLYNTPQEVKKYLAIACFDCHSNNTKYPWYANIQPIAFWLNNHIVSGKDHLNFDEFGSYKLRKQYHKLEEVITEVQTDKEMPLDSYTWIHKGAKLTDDQRKKIADWALSIQDTLKALYPLDSLIRKKTSN